MLSLLKCFHEQKKSSPVGKRIPFVASKRSIKELIKSPWALDKGLNVPPKTTTLLLGISVIFY